MIIINQANTQEQVEVLKAVSGPMSTDVHCTTSGQRPEHTLEKRVRKKTAEVKNK